MDSCFLINNYIYNLVKLSVGKSSDQNVHCSLSRKNHRVLQNEQKTNAITKY